jgi:hypothetical protein
VFTVFYSYSYNSFTTDSLTTVENLKRSVARAKSAADFRQLLLNSWTINQAGEITTGPRQRDQASRRHSSRAARWYIFKPTIPILIYILEGLSLEILVYIMTNWYIL